MTFLLEMTGALSKADGLIVRVDHALGIRPSDLDKASRS